MTFIFATNNKHKVDEIRAVLPSHIKIVSLHDAGIDADVPEPHDTLEENARDKALAIYHRTGTDCFSEDSGLEVDVLNGEPGVHSARYAGEEKSANKNTAKLLEKMIGATDRSAQFRTVICLVTEGAVEFFEGVCRGTVATAPRGASGFGYDPIFVPEGAGKTFAEMDSEEKARWSHRRKAVDRLVAFLNQTPERK